MLVQRLLLALVGVVAWGIFSRTISGPQDFLSNFLNGLSNFCFFVIGLLSDLIGGPANRETSTRVMSLADRSRTAGIGRAALRTAIALTLFMVALALLSGASIMSVDQMERRGDAQFNSNGYRDVQTYFIGYISFSLLVSVIGYFYYIGSRYRTFPFMGIFMGSTVSMGLVMVLYLIYGAFQPMQIVDYIGIQVPEALGPYRELVAKVAGWALTLTLDVLTTFVFSSVLWAATCVGYFLNKNES